MFGRRAELDAHVAQVQETSSITAGDVQQHCC